MLILPYLVLLFVPVVVTRPEKQSTNALLEITQNAQIGAPSSNASSALLPTLSPEDKKVRKALKKKRRKLRKLRLEVRQLREQLVTQPLPDDNLLLGDESGGPAPLPESQPAALVEVKKRLKHKWRRRIMKELRRLSKRLDKLEEENSIEKKESDGQQKSHDRKNGKGRKKKRRRQERRKAKQLKRLLRGKPDRKSPVVVDETALKIAEKEYKISTLHSAYNRSLLGHQGRQCAAHRDCRPGLCCHRGMNTSDWLCVEHSLEQSITCSDSCQCAAGLHCFVSAKDKRDREIAQQAQGKCKRATADDIVHGTYLNAHNSVFDGQDV